MKKNVILLFVVFSFFACGSNKLTQQEATQLSDKIENQTFVFIPTTANPMGGKSIHLTPDYELRITKDSIVSYMPYFGRAYSAPYGSDGGIKFLSKKFDYTLHQKTKHKWEIEIETKDTSNQYKIYLTVFQSGNASLSVNDPNRQTITFLGNVK